MYAYKYKLNNSYTTYAILDDTDDIWHRKLIRHPKQNPLVWEVGSSVQHRFYGLGKICCISNRQISVIFNESRCFGKRAKIKVDFGFILKPSEIESLKLC